MKTLVYIITVLFIPFITGITANAQNPALSNITVTSASINTGDVVTYTINFNYTGDNLPHTLKITDVFDNTRFTVALADIAVPTGFSKSISGGLITCVGNISGSTSSITGQIVITATAKCEGKFKTCISTNTARIYLDGNSVPTDTKTKNVTISAHNKWQILKTLVGMVSTNTFRYKITISSQGCDAYNLYGASLNDVPLNGGRIINYNGTSLPSLTTYTVGLGTLLVGNTYTNYIDVKYPCTLPSGQVVTNCATLTGRGPGNNCVPMPLGQIETQQSCANATISPYSFTVGPNAPSKTHLTDRNHSPGCEDEYTISYQNVTSGIISNLQVCDVFPFNYLELAPTCTSAFTVYINGVAQALPLPRVGATCSNSNPVINISNCPVVPSNLSWNFPNLNPNDIITIKIRVKIRTTAPIGQQVSNTVNLSGTANAAYSVDVCTGTVYPSVSISSSVTDNFTVQAAAPRPVISKQITNGSVFAPGDVVKFKVCISNYGGASFTGKFSDFIDDRVFQNTSIADFNLTAHLDNDEPNQCSYDALSTDVSGAFSYNSGTHTLESGNITIPGICLLNRYANLVIEFEARLKTDAWLCKYVNTAKFNITSPSVPAPNPITASVNYYVQDAGLLGFSKLVDGNLDGIFSSTEQTVPGQTVRYRIELTNLGSVGLKNIKILDNLPKSADQSINTGAARGSTSPAFIITGSPTGSGSLTFASSATQRYGIANPFTLVSSGPSSFGAVTNSSAILSPNSTIWMEYSAQVPLSATQGQVAFNDALVMADLGYDLTNPPSTCMGPTNTGYSLAPTNSPPAKLEIVAGIPCCVGKTGETSIVQESVAYYPEGTIWTPTLSFSYSGLPVKKITVSVVNSWITYDNTECAKEFTSPLYIGTLFKNSPPASLNFGNLVFDPMWAAYAPTFSWFSGIFIREMIYNSVSPGAVTNFNTAQQLTLGIILPSIKTISCCSGKATIVLKFSVEDVNCNICDYFFIKDNIAILPQ